jgi:hypothetical protein
VRKKEGFHEAADELILEKINRIAEGGEWRGRQINI